MKVKDIIEMIEDLREIYNTHDKKLDYYKGINKKVEIESLKIRDEANSKITKLLNIEVELE